MIFEATTLLLHSNQKRKCNVAPKGSSFRVRSCFLVDGEEEKRSNRTRVVSFICGNIISTILGSNEMCVVLLLLCLIWFDLNRDIEYSVQSR